MVKAVVILGSEKDREFAEPILTTLEGSGVKCELHVASAHKKPEKVLEIVRSHEGEEHVVFITVAGRSNALSGMVDANTRHPVIACPNLKGEFAPVDVFSSLRMPGGVAPMAVLDPENAALAALKILALADTKLREALLRLQQKFK